jgi:hypothetical protein
LGVNGPPNHASIPGDLTDGKLRSAIRNHVTANQAVAGRTVTGGRLDAAAAPASVD